MTTTDHWKYVDVQGIRTRYRSEGTGEPVVMFHGGNFGAGSADTWPDELISMLAGAGCQVVAVDRLGQGLTDNPLSDDGYLMSAVIDHAAAFLKELGLSGATLVGQSRGGFVVSRLAQLHPELARRLVVINSGTLAIRYPAEAVPGLASYRVYNQLATGDSRHDGELMSVTTAHITDTWVAAREEIARLPKSVEARAAHDRLGPAIYAEFEGLKADTLKWMAGGGHRKPTLLVWGVGDPTTTARDALDLFEVMTPHVDQLRLAMINRCGHWPHREYPLEVADEIRQFIART